MLISVLVTGTSPSSFPERIQDPERVVNGFCKFVRDDGVASRTDVKEFYFAEERVRFLIASPKLNFFAPIDIQFLDD